MSEWMDVYPLDAGELADAIENRLSEGQNVTIPDNSKFENVRNQWSSLLDSL